MPFGPYRGSIVTAYAIVVVVVIGLLLIGLFSDTYFGPILLGSLAGGAIVGFFFWFQRRRRSSVSLDSWSTRSLASTQERSDPRNPRSKEVWNPEPRYLVPFGPYGGGQWTAHPIGLVIVIGLLLMGLVSKTPVSVLILASLAGGAILALFLWLLHR